MPPSAGRVSARRRVRAGAASSCFVRALPPRRSSTLSKEHRLAVQSRIREDRAMRRRDALRDGGSPQSSHVLHAQHRREARTARERARRMSVRRHGRQPLLFEVAAVIVASVNLPMSLPSALHMSFRRACGSMVVTGERADRRRATVAVAEYPHVELVRLDANGDTEPLRMSESNAQAPNDVLLMNADAWPVADRRRGARGLSGGKAESRSSRAKTRRPETARHSRLVFPSRRSGGPGRRP